MTAQLSQLLRRTFRSLRTPGAFRVIAHLSLINKSVTCSLLPKHARRQVAVGADAAGR